MCFFDVTFFWKYAEMFGFSHLVMKGQMESYCEVTNFILSTCK